MPQRKTFFDNLLYNILHVIVLIGGGDVVELPELT